MANKYKTSLKRKDVFFMSFDAKRLADAIEKAGGDVKPAIERAARRSLPLIESEFKSFIAKHHLTGETESSLLDLSQVQFLWGASARKRYDFQSKSVKIFDNDSILYFEYGFDAQNGGLPAMFLDIGTPTQKPYFFIYYAVENNLSKIHAIQKEELNKILKELEG